LIEAEVRALQEMYAKTALEVRQTKNKDEIDQLLIKQKVQEDLLASKLEELALAKRNAQLTQQKTDIHRITQELANAKEVQPYQYLPHDTALYQQLPSEVERGRKNQLHVRKRSVQDDNLLWGIPSTESGFADYTPPFSSDHPLALASKLEGGQRSQFHTRRLSVNQGIPCQLYQNQFNMHSAVFIAGKRFL